MVAPPTHDTASAVAGVPTANTGKPNWAYISSGTWSLMGIEVADITPGITAATPLNLIFTPWSHSLLMHIVWGVVLGGVVYAFRKNARESMILAIVVLLLSAWARSSFINR